MGLLIKDAYTDTDGTSLPSHSIAPTNGQGLTYSQPIGGYHIESNQITEVTTNAAGQVAVLATGASDATISLDVVVQDGNVTRSDGSLSFRTLAGICFRFQDANNYWAFLVVNDTHNQSNAYYTVLRKIISGTVTTVQTMETTLSLNASTQTIKIVLAGSTMNMFRNGSGIGTTTTDTDLQSQTNHGVTSLYTGEADILHNHYPWNVMDNLEIDVASSVQGACLLIGS